MEQAHPGTPGESLAMHELARATILQIWEVATPGDSGITVGLMLEVRRRGQPPYQTEVKQQMSRAVLVQVQPGTTLAVRVDAHNPGRVQLELGGPILHRAA